LLIGVESDPVAEVKGKSFSKKKGQPEGGLLKLKLD